MVDETVEALEGERHGGDGHTDHGHHGLAAYHVNNREGRVAAPHGENLKGREILHRAGLSAEKYELFTIVHGKTGPEIGPDETHHVKPGDHYRATIRGTDFSSPAGESPCVGANP